MILYKSGDVELVCKSSIRERTSMFDYCDLFDIIAATAKKSRNRPIPIRQLVILPVFFVPFIIILVTRGELIDLIDD